MLQRVLIKRKTLKRKNRVLIDQLLILHEIKKLFLRLFQHGKVFLMKD
jgi:hypothetical protein